MAELNRERIAEGSGSVTRVADDPATANPSPSKNDPSELGQLRQQLEARDRELKDAQEEAELTLLQLHQVQEELEHYFLESRDLQQKLDAVQTITPEQLAQLERIKARLLELFKTLPAPSTGSPQRPSSNRLEILVRRQQNALRRFERLHAASSDA